MLKSLTHLQYPWPKLLIVGLLGLNALIYTLTSTLTSALDALTWLLLLLLYEFETNDIHLPWSNSTLQQVRHVLFGILVFVFLSYLFDGEWLDVLNTLLWFCLVTLLELEVREPVWAMAHERFLWLGTITVFIGLVGMVGLWAWQQAWLNAYDALLWIAAFALIEVDMFQWLRRKQTKP